MHMTPVPSRIETLKMMYLRARNFDAKRIISDLIEKEIANPTEIYVPKSRIAPAQTKVAKPAQKASVVDVSV